MNEKQKSIMYELKLQGLTLMSLLLDLKRSRTPTRPFVVKYQLLLCFCARSPDIIFHECIPLQLIFIPSVFPFSIMHKAHIKV